MGADNMNIMWPFDEELLEALSRATGYGLTVEEFEQALLKMSQSLLGPETGAEIVIPNSKTDLEIFDQKGEKIEKVNFHLIEKIHII